MLARQRRGSRPRLPDQVTLVHGPHAVLGRFLLLADRAARDRGVYLSLEDDFDALLALNEANRAHWHPIAPSFDPRVSDVGPDNAFWIVGRNEDGEAVLTQVVRHYPLTDSTLADELQTLRFFYRDPARSAQAGERCEVNTPDAARIRGSVVYSGGTWFRPDYRGLGLASIVPRMGRAIALSRWNTDFAFSLVLRRLVEKQIPRRYGFRHVEYAVDWRGSTAGEHLEFALIWIAQDDFVFDLETTMVLHGPTAPREREAGSRPRTARVRTG
jgi:hypothetical protein